jgi:GGDEF domain-containing protein
MIDTKALTEEKNEADEALRMVWTLLTHPKLLAESETSEFAEKYEIFNKIVKSIADIRDISFALSKGEVNRFVDTRGFIISNLKALQSNLRHLTWQTKKIADGDFTQRVDFLGDFSESFNEMTLKLKHYNDELTKLANFDPLTQIPNRLSLNHFLSQAFERFVESRELFSILMLDIDFFKKVNDTYGHDAGDKVLVSMSALVKHQFRSSDMFARYGGEEFMAVMTNCGSDIAEKKRTTCIGSGAEYADKNQRRF